jgi:hypothetical protein
MIRMVVIAGQWCRQNTFRRDQVQDLQSTRALHQRAVLELYHLIDLHDNEAGRMTRARGRRGCRSGVSSMRRGAVNQGQCIGGIVTRQLRRARHDIAATAVPTRCGTDFLQSHQVVTTLCDCWWGQQISHSFQRHFDNGQLNGIVLQNSWTGRFLAVSVGAIVGASRNVSRQLVKELRYQVCHESITILVSCCGTICDIVDTTILGAAIAITVTLMISQYRKRLARAAGAVRQQRDIGTVQ